MNLGALRLSLGLRKVNSYHKLLTKHCVSDMLTRVCQSEATLNAFDVTDMWSSRFAYKARAFRSQSSSLSWRVLLQALPQSS